MNNYITLDNLIKIYDLEISKKVKNKRRIYRFELYKTEYLIAIRDELLSGKYKGGNYNLFVINKPKLRLIMSQNIYDKIINHFITKYILEPKLTKYLLPNNAATRKNMGTSYAIELFKKFLEISKNQEEIYILKFDISKYFYSIDHEVLKKIIKDDLSEKEYQLLEKIIDSTNNESINKYIDYINIKYKNKIPRYEYGKGLPIGNVSSQFLAILYLHKLHKYIIHELKLSYMVIYMDDYIIIHHDQLYLKKCLEIIKSKLKEEYKLDLNQNKTVIRNIKYGIDFLGYNFRVINKKTIIKITGSVKRKLKKNFKKLKYENNNELVNFETMFSSIMNYKNSYIYASKYEIEKIMNEYWY